MILERTKNAKKGIMWGLFAKIVGLLFPFLVRTTIIKTIGIEYVGINGLFTSLLEILNLTELGVGTAIVYSMYKPIAEGDKATICALMNLFKKLYRVIGLVVLFIGILLLPFTKYLVKGDVPDDVNLYIIYAIYLSNTVITYWLFAYKNCLLNAHQRTDIINKVSLVLTALLYSIQIVVLFVFKNYYTFIILNPLIGIFINITNAYYAGKLFPEYICRGKISKELQTDIKKRIGGLMLTKIAYKVRYSLGNVVVSAFLGLQIIAIYNNYYYIMSAIGGLFSIVTTSITAGIGNSIAIETKEKNESDMNVLSFIYLSFSLLCFCCLLSLYQPFMYYWVGSENMFPSMVMILFSMFFLVDKTLNIVGIYYDAAGLWWKGKYKGLIEATVHIALTVVLSKYYGVYGTLIAAILSVLLVGFPLTSYIIYKHYYSKSSLHYIFKHILIISLFALVGTIPYFFSKYIVNEYFSDKYLLGSIASLVLNIILCVALYISIFYRTEIFRRSVEWVKIHL